MDDVPAADERLARHVHIPNWDQRRLHDATVVVVEVGGSGTEVSRLLALAGVGQLVLCDPDRIEISNLNRGSLFGPGDVGEFKVEVAARELTAMAPGIQVERRADRFQYGVGLGELRAADLVLSCLDSIADRVALSSRCKLAGCPLGLLDGGVHPWGGEVRHYGPEGPCYACGCSPADRSLPAWHAACGVPDEAGASAPVVAYVAAQQATQAVRLLNGERPAAIITKMDALTPENSLVHVSPNPDCPCHDVIDPNHVTRTALTPESTVAELLALAGPDEQVLSWNPIDRADALSPLSLRAADPAAPLAGLGIPPAEILPIVRLSPVTHVRYLELKGAW